MTRLLPLTLAAALLCAQSPAPSPYQDPDRKLFAEIDQHNELLANLEYLSDRIGARVTGSEALKRANHWTLEKLRGYGVDTVGHLTRSEWDDLYAQASIRPWPRRRG